MSWRHLPNALTALRLVLTPLLYAALAAGRPRQALVLLAVAALSDALDGLLARRFGWQSRLGGLLDPIADKLVLNASFLGLWMFGALPDWFIALVIGRDLLIVAGAVGYHLLVRPLQPEPSLLGKLNTVVQVLFALLLILQLGFPLWPSHWVQPAVWIVALVTAASGVDYVIRWSGRAWRERRQVP